MKTRERPSDGIKKPAKLLTLIRHRTTSLTLIFALYEIINVDALLVRDH